VRAKKLILFWNKDEREKMNVGERKTGFLVFLFYLGQKDRKSAVLSISQSKLHFKYHKWIYCR
jgi:hypothetical protein